MQNPWYCVISSSMSDSVHFLPIDHIQPNPFQPRGKVNKDEIEELTASILTYGILEPLVIAQTPAGYQIIAGERRWRAAKEAGLTEVPVVIKKTTPRGMLEMAIVENVQRIDLNPIERAQAFQQLMRDFGFSNTQISEKIGKSPSYISNSLKLLEMPDAIKDGLVGGLITEGHARAISGIQDDRLMVECYKIILKENASVRRAEDIARRLRDQSGDPKIVGQIGGSSFSDKEVAHWQKNFQQLFHAKSEFKFSRSLKQTKVSIILKGPPEQTQTDLEKILAFANIEIETKE
jgi:ParB family transcriptional regulator, chromosome partitioning protein